MFSDYASAFLFSFGNELFHRKRKIYQLAYVEHGDVAADTRMRKKKIYHRHTEGGIDDVDFQAVNLAVKPF